MPIRPPLHAEFRRQREGKTIFRTPKFGEMLSKGAEKVGKGWKILANTGREMKI